MISHKAIDKQNRERVIDWMQKLEESQIDECAWIALEEIDSALFTGDGFHNEKDLKELKRYLIRWVREVKNIDEMLKDNEIVDKNKML